MSSGPVAESRLCKDPRGGLVSAGGRSRNAVSSALTLPICPGDLGSPWIGMGSVFIRTLPSRLNLSVSRIHDHCSKCEILPTGASDSSSTSFCCHETSRIKKLFTIEHEVFQHKFH